MGARSRGRKWHSGNAFARSARSSVGGRSGFRIHGSMFSPYGRERERRKSFRWRLSSRLNSGRHVIERRKCPLEELSGRQKSRARRDRTRGTCRDERRSRPICRRGERRAETDGAPIDRDRPTRSRCALAKIRELRSERRSAIFFHGRFSNKIKEPVTLASQHRNKQIVAFPIITIATRPRPVRVAR